MPNKENLPTKEHDMVVNPMRHNLPFDSQCGDVYLSHSEGLANLCSVWSPSGSTLMISDLCHEGTFANEVSSLYGAKPT